MTGAFEIWLSVDTSSPAGSLALHRWANGELTLLAERAADSTGNLTEVLIKKIQELLRESDVPLAAVDRFVTTTGPGSFTGLRLAMASLKAFALATGKPVLTVSAPEARWIAAGRPKGAFVLTHVTNEKVVVSRFEGNEWAEAVETYAELAGKPSLVLTEERVDEKRLPAAWPVERLPLRASLLAEAAPTARSRRDHRGEAEIIALSPDYRGTSFKPIFAGA